MARQAIIGGSGGGGVAMKVLGWGVVLAMVAFIVKRPERAADLFLRLLDGAMKAIDAGSSFLAHLS